MKKIFLLSCIVLILIPGLLLSMPLAEKQAKAKKLVEEGIKYYQEHGKEAAIKAFEDPKGKFIDGEFYLFGLNFEGITFVHGQNPDMKGNSLIKVRDANGVMFFAKFILIARKEGEGWVDYQWLNKQKKIADKSSFVKNIPNTELILGCGFYK